MRLDPYELGITRCVYSCLKPRVFIHMGKAESRQVEPGMIETNVRE
jgi:hypothetical protein